MAASPFTAIAAAAVAAFALTGAPAAGTTNLVLRYASENPVAPSPAGAAGDDATSDFTSSIDAALASFSADADDDEVLMINGKAFSLL